MRITFTKPQKAFLNRLIETGQLLPAKMYLIEIVTKKPKLDCGVKHTLLRVHKNLKFIALIANNCGYCPKNIVKFSKECDFIIAKLLLENTRALDGVLKKLGIDTHTKCR